MSRRKKKSKAKAAKAMTEKKGNWWRVHNHAAWVTVGEYSVWLKSSTGKMHQDLDVYIDLAGFSVKRVIPPELVHIVPTPKPMRMVWEIDDGYTDPDLPTHVINLLKAGYLVGWGCLGGHGRTGWLAAKVHQMLTGCSGVEAVNHIRSTFCKEAIETAVQLHDLGIYGRSDARGGILSEDDEPDWDNFYNSGAAWKEEPGENYNKYLKQWGGNISNSTSVITGKVDNSGKIVIDMRTGEEKEI